MRRLTPSRSKKIARRRGVAAVLAMLFLVVGTTLAVGIFSAASLNAQAAGNHADAIRAQAAADGGLAWFGWRLKQMPRPKTTAGTITPGVANTLWPTLRTAIAADLGSMTNAAERSCVQTSTSLTSSPVAFDASEARFAISVRQHPLDASDTLDQRFLRISSTGTAGDAVRTSSCDFRIDKRIRFAIAGRVPIQIGRNTLVEGAMGMATAGKTPPFLLLSDFAGLNAALTVKLLAFQAFCELNHSGFDNRIAVGSDEAPGAVAAGFNDANDDGYIDEYDLFLKQYDTNSDKAISRAEFTNIATGKLVDENLFAAIDSLGAPQFAGDPARAGYLDGKIDNRDGYAKVHGQIAMAASQTGWETTLSASGQTINDMLAGPIVVDGPAIAPVKFNATSTDIFDLSPDNFEACASNFRARSGTAGGAARRVTGRIENTTLLASDANATSVTERTPFGSTTYQATYKRPVYKNLALKNVIIPQGTNALFDGCTFEGVTFVDTQRDITTSANAVTTDPNNGMSWSQRKISGGTFGKDQVLLATGTPTSAQTITEGSQKGNNLRFNNCVFNGPIAGNYATAYTHFANSWEFTGSTLFNNQVDQTATIVSPQVNIEMGSFTDPTLSPSTLVGVVVAGNLDIRGTSVVDGSIIITGDGAGNTTLGYFGPSDGDTNPTAMPEGGFGRLNVRYNPNRALPDGINLAVDVLAEPGTYRESQ